MAFSYIQNMCLQDTVAYITNFFLLPRKRMQGWYLNSLASPEETGLHLTSIRSSVKRKLDAKAYIFFVFQIKSQDNIIFTEINPHKRSYEFRLMMVFSCSCISFSPAFVQIASMYHQECIIYHSSRYCKYSEQDGESLLTY